MGKAGVYYRSLETERIIRPLAVPVINTNGAGDAFSAGVVYGMLNNQDIDQCARLGLVSASFAVSHELPVNPGINEQKLQQYLNDNEVSLLAKES